MIAATSGRSWRRYAGIAFCFAVAYAAAYLFGAQFRTATGVSPFWPGAGVMLAWFLLGGPGQIPIAFLTVLGMRFAVRSDFDLPQDAIKALVLAVGYASVAILIRKLVPFDRWWTRLRDPVLFLAISFPSCLAIGLIATLKIRPGSGEPLFNVGQGLDFGLGDFIGCLMCGPLIALSVLAWKSESGPFRYTASTTLSGKRAVEVGCQVGLMMFCTYFAFVKTNVIHNDAEHLLFLPMLWIVFRNGVKGAAWGGFVLALVTSLAMLFVGLGPQQIGSLQVFYITILTSSFVLGVTISGREKALVELASSEHRYELAAQAAQDGVWEYDITTRQLLCSDALKRIMGDESMNSIQPLSWWEDRIHPEDRGWVLTAIENHVQTNVPYNIQYRLRHASGEYIWVFAFGQVVRNAKGQAIKMCGALNDISERRRAEFEIQSLNAELEIRVAGRTAELQLANDELASFSYSVSHDLRGPLRAINGFAKLLEDECGNDIHEDGKMYLERIRAASVRMGTLIDDLLQLSRMGRFEPRRDSVDVSALAQSIVEDLQVNQPERKVEVRVSPEMEAQADPTLLRNMLQNLLQNAWKFTAQKDRALIEIGREWRDDEWTYFVRDNGIGFDPQYSAKLFLPFERLHSDPAFPGTGIGLATVAKVAHLHGGRVWAEGQKDEGAIFYFTLGPASTPSPIASR